jgi:hypothetical protein
MCKSCLINRLCALRSMMTGLFGICTMVVETGIPQFHESVYTMSVKVLWLSMKPQCDWFLYTCIHIKAMIFMCLFHRLELMTAKGGQLWTVGWMWKNFPPKLLQLCKSGSCSVG